MLTIKVNGREEKLNIGCRTFIALDELLRLLTVNDVSVVLNGDAVESGAVPQTLVKGGDSITYKQGDSV